ncbi:MAG: hypothetical protein P1U68_08455 [Verrucomicrobiales bacterium]|nr:hypothetical protein [Verrucomicrobiales bacterium]
MNNVPGLEAIYRDYKSKGVDFYFIYKSLAHPERDGLVQPVTIDERLAHIKKAKVQLSTTIPWIADSMSNELKNALGNRNNSEIVVSPDGTMVVARDWSDPSALRLDLERLVGKAETLTEVTDLKAQAPAAGDGHAAIPRGIVPRVERPDSSEPLIVTTKGDEPFYLKLRAEAEKSVARESKGTLHLSFQLDPIHEVHWNNLAPPMRYSIAVPEGAIFTPSSGEAAKVSAAKADMDPREFLVELDLSTVEAGTPIIISVDYFACDDADRWCKPVTQTFEISLETDRDAGRVQIPGGGRGGTKGGGMKGRGKGSAGPGRGMPSAENILSRFDTNEDGALSREEATGPMAQRFDQMDTNRDGSVSIEELEARLARR